METFQFKFHLMFVADEVVPQHFVKDTPEIRVNFTRNISQ